MVLVKISNKVPPVDCIVVGVYHIDLLILRGYRELEVEEGDGDGEDIQ